MSFPSSPLSTSLLLLLPAMAGCMGPGGQSGPEYAEPQSAEGPCFEADLTDGIEDGDEVMVVFECFNQYGAFDELEPLVDYLTSSEVLPELLDAANETLGSFDVVAGLEIAVRLLSDEDAPLSRASRLYTEAVDEGLMVPAMGLMRESSAELVQCEGKDNPLECNPLRLARYVLDTEVPDQASSVLDAIDVGVDEETAAALAEGTATLLYQTSTVYPGHEGGNDLLAVARFMLDEHPVLEGKRDGGACGEPLDASVEDPTPIAHLLPYLQYLLSGDIDGDGASDPDPDDDDLLAALAPGVAGLYRKGVLQEIPAELVYVFTHNSAGADVGWDGENILDELMAVSEDLGTDPAMLCEEMELGDETATTLEFALDTADQIYLNGSDVSEIVTKLEEMVDLICEGDDSSAICALAGKAIPPITALVENAPNLTEAALPLVYALHDTVDMQKLIPMMGLLLDLDLMGETRALTTVSLQTGTLEHMIEVVPVLINPEMGRLTPAGRDAGALLAFAITEWTPDGERDPIVPALVMLDLGDRVLNPYYPNADLDVLLGTAGRLMLDEESGLHPDNLSALLDDLSAAMGDNDVDLMEQARKILDNETLWTSALALGADSQLINLLTPIEGQSGAAWYLYDTIDSGLLDRILTYVAGLTDLLVENGIVEARSAQPRTPDLTAQPAALAKGGR